MTAPKTEQRVTAARLVGADQHCDVLWVSFALLPCRKYLFHRLGFVHISRGTMRDGPDVGREFPLLHFARFARTVHIVRAQNFRDSKHLYRGPLESGESHRYSVAAGRNCNWNGGTNYQFINEKKREKQCESHYTRRPSVKNDSSAFVVSGGTYRGRTFSTN